MTAYSVRLLVVARRFSCQLSCCWQPVNWPMTADRLAIDELAFISTPGCQPSIDIWPTGNWQLTDGQLTADRLAIDNCNKTYDSWQSGNYSNWQWAVARIRHSWAIDPHQPSVSCRRNLLMKCSGHGLNNNTRLTRFCDPTKKTSLRWHHCQSDIGGLSVLCLTISRNDFVSRCIWRK